MLIRKATPKDDERVKALCLTDNPKDFVPGIWPVWMAGKNTTNLVAVADGRIIGCIYGEIISGHDAWAQGLRVHPDFRKRGIGTKLMMALESDLFQMGGKDIYANIGAFNEASLSTVLKLKWRIDTHFIRRRSKPTGRLQNQPVLFSRDRILKLIHGSPILASCKKVAYFQRAYFSMTNHYIDQAFRKNTIRVSPDGRAYAITDLETDPAKKIWVVAMAGEAPGIQWLLESFMGDAGRLGVELVIDSTKNHLLQSLMDKLQFCPPEKNGHYVVVKKDLSEVNTNF